MQVLKDMATTNARVKIVVEELIKTPLVGKISEQDIIATNAKEELLLQNA